MTHCTNIIDRVVIQKEASFGIHEYENYHNLARCAKNERQKIHLAPCNTKGPNFLMGSWLVAKGIGWPLLISHIMLNYYSQMSF